MKDPQNLMDIVDEALTILEDKLDLCRLMIKINPVSANWPKFWQDAQKDNMTFLKDLRDLLKLSENFRD